MKEGFLHFVWKFQYFHKENLSDTDGEALTIIHPGFLNDNAGPDFLNSKIICDNITWNGNIEIHLKSSDWLLHKHHEDDSYENVVLHVVWKEDKAVFRKDGTRIPTLELKDRVFPDVILKFQELINTKEAIPCGAQLGKVPEVILCSMLDKALSQRLKNKSEVANELYVRSLQNWEEAAYRLLAKNFGFKINSESFLELSKIVPYKVILKHSDNLFQIEALLFGQAGFLKKNVDDDYYVLLQKEYDFLKHKYGLDYQLNMAQWKFLRLRPSNFPTIRIAQFAVVLHQNKSLFSLFTSFESYEYLCEKLGATQSKYWRKHYNFGKESQGHISGLGKSSVNNIIINTVTPLLTSLGKQYDNQDFVDKAIDLLEKLPAENNKILDSWKKAGWSVKNSYDSQALIELYNSFCMQRQCLNCKIGTALIK